MSTRFELRLPEGVLERVDAARGDVSRSRFVLRAIEAALGSAQYPFEAERVNVRGAVDSGARTARVVPGSLRQTWARPTR